MHRCSANERCLYDGSETDEDLLFEQYDNYGIYAGRWHDKCWDKYGYGDFVFDPSYAGESLEEPE